MEKDKKKHFHSTCWVPKGWDVCLILPAALPCWNFAEERMQACYYIDPYHKSLSDYITHVLPGDVG